MEKLADKVEHYLDQQLNRYELLQSVFDEEKKQIVQMDVDGLWKTTALKKKIFQELEQLNVEIKFFIESRAAELGEAGKEFKFSDLILRMPASRMLKSKLKHIRQALELCKKNVFVAAMANKQYIQDSLSVINDIFSSAMQTATEKKYGYSGQLLDSSEKSNLINTEV